MAPPFYRIDSISRPLKLPTHMEPEAAKNVGIFVGIENICFEKRFYISMSYNGNAMPLRHHIDVRKRS
jgi:hypothetical protein